ncbi:nucleotidyltransferase family protein [Nibribacter koreensis]|uniref:Nucleotidyltransferase family protein n=1 Tax=Nibribacter koreensis TaxID=1084519 RepID=A0ABP8F5H6_9BACT
MSIAIIILAAGSSSRMGHPKQQLSYQGKTLVQHVAEIALGSKADQVLVVLGANSEQIIPEIAHLPIKYINNLNWEEGMAASIKAGLHVLQKFHPVSTNALFLLCDQPLITADLLNAMMQAKDQTDKGIIACAYAETVGAPVLFDARYFTELNQLQGQEGAKKVLLKHMNQVHAIPFPAAALDIDTPEDYLTLQQMENGE